MEKNKIVIFADGSSRGNPGPGGWGAVVADTLENKVFEIGGREIKTTNNKMELTAAIEALKKMKHKNPEINIYTDSSYVINGITKWIFGWQKNSWITKDKKDVLNSDLWKKLSKETSDKKIEWHHIAGHAGVVGNERADAIATSFADKEKVKLYKGTFSKYGFDILNFKETKTKPNKNKARKGKAYSYVSSIDGKIMIHKTWEDTERRVKGKNARFKKALSKEEENKIVEEFTLLNNRAHN